MANGTGDLTAPKGEEVEFIDDDYCHHCENESSFAEYDKWCAMMDSEQRMRAIHDREDEQRSRRYKALASSEDRRNDGRTRRDWKLHRQQKAFAPDP
ncbi:hypothetical protein HQ524_02905 [Candidatus Uhrbacteria bacterium]|nr:hypothetical protein [Candidatus Uhrbacteria bacterium]